MSVQAEVLEETEATVSTSLRAIVKVKESDTESWKETVDVISVSSTGAGFYSKRECQVGRLVAIVIPLDPELRCYDHDQQLYPVFGLVQHCHLLANDDDVGYHVGVAFVGKQTPESYGEDPTQSYRICGMDENGLWKIKEADKEFKPRKDARFYQAIEHYLARVDSRKSSVGGEKATTENISKHGAAVLTTLDVHVGDRVKFISEEYDFSGIAVVCNRKNGPDGRARLNLQFIGNSFPIEKVMERETAEGDERTFD